ncbi:DNA polymerase alpha/epsilon subunit B-domain-containing protein [Syncephalis fuscata]|nr:DNA polymerase alpha/epsilon subunit B-domain-containing protein [Syncephalis fuscata]
MSTKQKVYRAFTRKYGIVLHPEATDYVIDFMARHNLPEANQTQLLEQLALQYIQRTDNEGILNQAGMEELFRMLLNTGPSTTNTANTTTNNSNNSDNNTADSNDIKALDGTEMDIDQSLVIGLIDEHLHISNAFELPRWRYSHEQGKYIRDVNGEYSLLANAEAKIQMYNDRSTIIKQRLQQSDYLNTNHLFSTSSLRITNINSLRGRVGEEFLLFGMLSQLEEGRIHLEERDGQVALDLSTSIHSSGLFTENSFVLVKGMLMEDQVFKVQQLSMPPIIESYLPSSLNSIDFYGLSTKPLEYSLIQFEQHYQNASIVFLSDLHLDRPGIFDHLQTIFEGYASTSDPALLPIAFVFMGSFSSYPLHISRQHCTDQYKDNFNQLADLISQYRVLRDQCRFIFVPGPNDPWSGDTLPQRPIPDTFTEKLRTRLKHVTFTSNPCRIHYGSQNIVIFRSNLLAKMRRYCVVPADDRKGALSKQLVQTILSQGHLTPIPIYRQPIFWEVDHALRLYQTPDVLVLGDQASPFSVVQNGCQCFNPGSFPGNAHSWYVYWPASRTVEFSSISQATKTT